jgi:hypothetical protein
MDARHKKPPPSMRRTMVEFFVLGWLVSGALFVLDAPVWAFYAIAVPITPLIVHRVYVMDPKPRERRRSGSTD